LILVDHDPKLRNIERLRECVKDANKQLRNGQRYQEKPSIALVYQDDVLVPPDIVILAALYGDLTYTFPKGQTNAGQFFYGQNGVFGPNKNRAVSALSLIRNNTRPFTVHNYWAHLALPPGLLAGREVTFKDDGRFEFTDYLL
jgi:hypothetical protein